MGESDGIDLNIPEGERLLGGLDWAGPGWSWSWFSFIIEGLAGLARVYVWVCAHAEQPQQYFDRVQVFAPRLFFTPETFFSSSLV